jgi:sRNA-binding protein
LNAALDCLQQLSTAYPQTFFIAGKQRKPLMIGITEKITQAMPQLDKQQLRKALMIYCGSYGYLKATLTETHRIDLNGQAVAEISSEDKASAELRLANREKPSKTAIAPAPEPIKDKPAVHAKNDNKETIMSNTPAAGIVAQATARAAKITLVLDNHSLTRVDCTGQKQIQLIVQVSEMTFTTELSSKSYRKAVATLDELGADNCVMILQGSMPTFGKLEGAGLVVQAKK